MKTKRSFHFVHDAVHTYADACETEAHSERRDATMSLAGSISSESESTSTVFGAWPPIPRGDDAWPFHPFAFFYVASPCSFAQRGHFRFSTKTFALAPFVSTVQLQTWSTGHHHFVDHPH